MSTIAEITLSPGSLIAWLVVGLIAGWIAARVLKGVGYGMIGDMIVGLIGAVISGLAFEFLVTGEGGFWGSIVVAFLGAHILIALVRFLGFRRPISRSTADEKGTPS